MPEDYIIWNSALLTVMVISIYFFVLNIKQLIQRIIVAHMKAKVIRATWRDFEHLLDSFLEDYECLGETGMGIEASYTPNSHERYLIKDAVMGFMAEPEAIDTLQAILKLKETKL